MKLLKTVLSSLIVQQEAAGLALSQEFAALVSWRMNKPSGGAAGWQGARRLSPDSVLPDVLRSHSFSWSLT